MRFRTLEIRWHDNKPISTCDFQPASFKKARPPAGQEKSYATHAYRLATGGEDNHVRLWMVHPHIRPAALAEEDASGVQGGPRPPRVEYLATLSRHSAAVNVVRWSPNGDLIASAGDDGMMIIWAPSTSPQATTYGSDLSPDELQYEKEYWKPRTSFRCTTMQVYDLAWSPTGEYIMAGSTDNTARVFASTDGKCVCEIAEHTHFVQGVAWDPLNEYIATQSSDRSMHIYRISTKNGVFEAHAVGRNTRLSHRHSRTPSVHNGNGTRARHGSPRPPMLRRESNSGYSDAESDRDVDVFGAKDQIAAPLTPSTSVASTPSTALSASMFPPPPVVPSASNPSAPSSVVSNNPSSRRSSFSGSNAPSSPQIHPHSYARYGRSPSPMPPLPAIRTPLTPPIANIRLYGDENFTNFFRRLTFSPDGGLLLTPAGQFEDPTVVVPPDGDNTTPTRGRKGRQTSVGAQGGTTQSQSAQSNSNSCVYIYSRANFARPPIAQLPGHKKASVAVRFSPVLYELRLGVVGPSLAANATGEQDPRVQAHDGPKVGLIDKGVEGNVDVDITAALNPASVAAAAIPVIGQRTPTRQKHSSSSQTPVVAPTPRIFGSGDGEGNMTTMSPSLLPTDIKPPTPAPSKPSTPAPTSGNATAQGATSAGVQTTGSVFALPYRMMFAVVTMDTVTIYDTQQSSPFCLLTKLHYDEFTDVSWSPDGQCLMLSSRDGYCTLVVFDEIVPAHHTQQHALQLQSIAHNHSVPLSLSTPHHGGTASTTATGSAITQSPIITPVSAGSSLSHPSPFTVTSSVPKKRMGGDPPLTPASTDGSESGGGVGLLGASTSRPVAESGGASNSNNAEKEEKSGQEIKIAEPPKKKRRVQLTRVGDLGS